MHDSAKKSSKFRSYLGISLLGIIGLIFLFYYMASPVIESKIKVTQVSTASHLVPLDEIVGGGPPKDGIPAIDNPKFVSVLDARSFVRNETLGILAKASDETKFYPYNILLWHEIVNDVVGGKSLAITFCPLCATGIVFEREINGTVYDFGTSGKLYKSNLVMYDRQTDSYWSQFLGESIVGRLSGTQLIVYPSAVVDFKTAATNNPNMKVLSTDTGYVRDYNFDPYSSYENSNYVGFGATFNDTRLPPKELTYGIIIDDKTKAYDYQKLISLGQLKDEFAGHRLNITVDHNKEINVFDETVGKRIVGIISYWFSWSIYNPRTELWNGS